MKKYIVLIIAVFNFFTTYSQSIADAVLYSNDNLTGTARFSAMSGAFGALGGDFSSIHVNPAGSAVFANNQVAITLSNFNIKNKADYYGSKLTTDNNTFDFAQLGGVLVFQNYNENNKWKKFVIAADYENVSNFDNSLDIFGTNPNESVANYFLSYANPGLYGSNIPVNTLANSLYENLDIRNQQAFLGYQGYIINVDPNNPNDNTYVANVTPGNFYHENYSESRGYNGKAAFNFGAQYTDKFYFGINLNSHFTDYKKTTSFYEENDNSQTQGLRNLYFENYQYTYGNGFSFQLGALAKVTESFRVGLSYESPTWYRLNDERIQRLSSTGFNYGNPSISGLSDITVDSNYLLIYPTYKLQTPSKWTGSLAYVFGKKGLISLDYSLKDFSNARFAPKDSFFRPLNTAINNTLDVSSELRLGGEYRIKQFSLRGGYRYEQSPYQDKNIVGDLTGFSTGFGYNFGNTKLDLSYSHSQRKSNERFFSQGFTAAPSVKSLNNNVALTLVFEL